MGVFSAVEYLVGSCFSFCYLGIPLHMSFSFRFCCWELSYPCNCCFFESNLFPPQDAFNFFFVCWFSARNSLTSLHLWFDIFKSFLEIFSHSSFASTLYCLSFPSGIPFNCVGCYTFTPYPHIAYPVFILSFFSTDLSLIQCLNCVHWLLNLFIGWLNFSFCIFQ